MQAKPLATNLGEQANKIAVSVQSGDGEVLALWGMCRRYAMQQATRWLRAFEGSGGVELDDLDVYRASEGRADMEAGKRCILHLVHHPAKGGICRGLRDEDETNARRPAQ